MECSNYFGSKNYWGGIPLDAPIYPHIDKWVSNYQKLHKHIWQQSYEAEVMELVATLHEIKFIKPSLTSEDLKSLDEQTFLDIFEGVPQASVSKEDIDNGLDMIGALAAKTGFLNSNGEARRALKENAISVNKEKVKEDFVISSSDIIANAYVLLQRGKKNYFLLKIA